MKKTTFLCCLLLAFAASPVLVASASPTSPEAQGELTREISALDTTVFDAFNHCSDPARLQEHAGYFAADVEFYHDNGGVTWTRDAMIANTGKHVCGHFTRDRFRGSRIYTIKDWCLQGGALLCQIASGQCEAWPISS